MVESANIHRVNQDMIRIDGDADHADCRVVTPGGGGGSDTRGRSSSRSTPGSSGNKSGRYKKTPGSLGTGRRKRTMYTPENQGDTPTSKGSVYKKEDRRVHGGLYNFHKVFPPSTTNAGLYEETSKSMVDTLFGGYNCTVMAYGQTGSGKSFTMMGYYEKDWKQRGIIPRILEDIFNRVSTRKKEGWSSKIQISNVQIYMEKVLDLLQPRSEELNPEKEPSLNVRQRVSHDGSEEIYVQGALWKKVKTSRDALVWLEEGNRNRVVNSTDMNSVSSRSHSVFMLCLDQMNLETGDRLCSSIYLVDLAGSETVRRTGAQGLTLQQASHVNKSLSTLSNVISSLANKRHHVPYRDSKLTRLLTHALGGNSTTIMILACSCTEDNLSETNSTLQFGRRALDMPNKPKVNKVLSIEDYQRMLSMKDDTLKQQKLVMLSLEAENDRLLKQLNHFGQPEQQVDHQVQDVRRKFINPGGEEAESSDSDSEDGSVPIRFTMHHSPIPHDVKITNLKRSMQSIRRSLDGLSVRDMTDLKEYTHEIETETIMEGPALESMLEFTGYLSDNEDEGEYSMQVTVITPCIGEQNEDEDEDEDRLTLPPVMQSTRRSHNTPMNRYFTPRTMSSLSDQLVARITNEKAAVELELVERCEQIECMNDRLLEAETKLHTFETHRNFGDAVISTLASDHPVTVESDDLPQTNDKSKENLITRHDDTYSSKHMNTMDTVLVVMGSLIVVGLYLALVVMNIAFKVPIQPALWGMLSGAVVGGLLLGLGLPKV
jgi:hypothetical protein